MGSADEVSGRRNTAWLKQEGPHNQDLGRQAQRRSHGQGSGFLALEENLPISLGFVCSCPGNRPLALLPLSKLALLDEGLALGSRAAQSCRHTRAAGRQPSEQGGGGRNEAVRLGVSPWSQSLEPVPGTWTLLPKRTMRPFTTLYRVLQCQRPVTR